MTLDSDELHSGVGIIAPQTIICHSEQTRGICCLLAAHPKAD